MAQCHDAAHAIRQIATTGITFTPTVFSEGNATAGTSPISGDSTTFHDVPMEEENQQNDLGSSVSGFVRLDATTPLSSPSFTVAPYPSYGQNKSYPINGDTPVVLQKGVTILERRKSNFRSQNNDISKSRNFIVDLITGDIPLYHIRNVGYVSYERNLISRNQE